MTIINNGKGWLIVLENNHWITYDQHTNKFCSGWGTYYKTKEEAIIVKERLINELLLA